MRRVKAESIRWGPERRVLSVPPSAFFSTVRARELWRSPALRLKGNTLLNAFVTVTVLVDNEPGAGLILTAGPQTLAASGLAPPAQSAQASSQVVTPVGGQIQYTGPGAYTFPMIPESNPLASTAVWVLAGSADLTNVGVRLLTVVIDGVLVAGGSTGVP